MDIEIENVCKQIANNEEQNKKLYQVLKKRQRSNNSLFFEELGKILSIDVIKICEDFIDFVVCWNCQSLYSKYTSCFHKLTSQDHTQWIQSLDTNFLVDRHNWKLLVDTINLDVAMSHFEDQSIWKYLMLQVEQNGYSFTKTDVHDYCGNIYNNLTLTIYKLHEDKTLLLYLTDTKGFRVYFARAEKTNIMAY